MLELMWSNQCEKLLKRPLRAYERPFKRSTANKREEKERSIRFSRLISPAPSNKGKSPLSNGRSLINNWQSPLSNGRSPPASNFENNKFEVDSRGRTTGQTDKKRKL